MHNYFKIYYFIDQFNLKELSGIKKKINIIFRQYNKKYDLKEILKTKDYCKKKGYNLFLANNIRLASRLNLNGVYIPSFNKNINFKNISAGKNFKIIGSAHNLKELRIKENQNCSEIFISPLFKTKKNNSFLDVVRFNLISIKTKKKIVALGGINFKTLNRIKMTKSFGIASISWIKKNGLNKNLGRFN